MPEKYTQEMKVGDSNHREFSNDSNDNLSNPSTSYLDYTLILAEANQAYLQKKYEKATAKYSQVAEGYAQMYGPLHPKCANVMFRYGRALLNHAIEKSGILGDTEQIKNVTGKREKDLLTALDESMTVELAPLKPSSRFEFDAANEVDEDEQEEDGEEGEEEEEDLENDDFEIAFEVLDVARVIYDLMLKGEIEKDVSDLGFEGKGKEKLDVDLIIKEKLSDVILTLADVGLESESFSQAIEDYQTALAMKSEFLSPGNRSLAETHYKLALAIEYGCQPLELALEHLKASRSVMLTRKAELGPSSFAESAEIEELVAELNLKIEDIEQQIYLRDHPVEKEKTEDLHPKNIDLAEVSNINDLSGFVKKKSVVATSHNSSASEESKRKRSLDEIDDESLAKDPSQHQESLKHVRLE